MNTRCHIPLTRSAFTLIELLTVIAVVVVLCTVLFGSLGVVRGKADNARCVTNLRSLGQLAQTQAAVNGGWVPQAMWDLANNAAARPNLRDHGLTDEGAHCPVVVSGRSYGINIKLIAGGSDGQWGKNDIQYWQRGRYQLSELDPVKAMAFTEATLYTSEDSLGKLAFRHQGFANVAYLDGHVDRVSREQLTQDEDDPGGKLFWTQGITTP